MTTPTAPLIPAQHSAPARSTGDPLQSLPVTLRPERSLLVYYALVSLLGGPAFPIAFLVLYVRFHTLRYDVDEEGITMRWGVLFRREVSLTYARIQDIHLTSNLFERYLGLARVQLQTASGSSKAEMIIEGMFFFETLRDFLYARMRGTHEPAPSARPEAPQDVLTATLQAVAAEVRALREELKGGRDA